MNIQICSLFIILIIVVIVQSQNSEDNEKKPFGKQRYQLAKLNDENPEDYYLPETMIPEKYKITLKPYFEKNLFTGSVFIHGRTEKTINSIVLHTLNQFIKTVDVYADDEKIDILDQRIDTEKEFLILNLNETLAPTKKLVLIISYEGLMDTTMKNRGLYIATYVDEFGTEKRLATTHMEPTNAREVFPCFDEPALKAEFEIQIIRPKQYNSKTNMPLSYTDIISDTEEIDTFHKTPLMSTYLVVIVISEFETISASYPIQATHELHGDVADLRKHYGDVGLIASRQVLNALEEYTGVQYSLPKIGQVAIPSGYFGGAMENWGLVIYGEDSLLFKPGVSTEIQRQGVFNIISHEYAHQWFGNLVGPESWAYTWLNEGFATFFTMLIPNLVKPEWRYVEQFAWKIPYAMSHDAKDTSRPMTMPVGRPENIRSTFDVIAYDKSACVLRMFENAMGRDTFRDALNIFLAKRKFKAANDEHLTTSFAEALQKTNPELAKDIKAKFDTWHLQKGFPLVTVTRDYDANTMTLKQEHFLTSNNETSQLWSIPINYFYKGSSLEERKNTQPEFWLDEKEITVQLPPEAKDSFVILNKGYTGYYRVNYDMDNWIRIYRNTNDFLDMSMNRVQLFDDALTLGLNNRLSMYVSAALFSMLRNDDNYLWVKASIPYFDQVLEVHHSSENVVNSFIQLYKKAYSTYANVQFDGDYIQSMLRNELIPRICRLGYEVCLEEMQQHMRDEFVINSPNLQESVICAGMMNIKDANESFTFVIDLINRTKETEIRNRLMRTLPCTKDVETGRRLMDWIIYPETNVLHWSDTALLKQYCTDYDNAKLAMHYFLESFDKLQQKYPFNSVKSFMMIIATRLYSEEMVQLVEKFMKETSLTENYRNMFLNVISTIKANIYKIENSPFQDDQFRL